MSLPKLVTCVGFAAQARKVFSSRFEAFSRKRSSKVQDRRRQRELESRKATSVGVNDETTDRESSAAKQKRPLPPHSRTDALYGDETRTLHPQLRLSIKATRVARARCVARRGSVSLRARAGGAAGVEAATRPPPGRRARRLHRAPLVVLVAPGAPWPRSGSAPARRRARSAVGERGKHGRRGGSAWRPSHLGAK